MKDDLKQDAPEVIQSGPSKKIEKVKSIIRNTKEILKRHKGDFGGEILKSKIVLYPEIKAPPIYNSQPVTELSMNRHTYASLIRESEPHFVSESSRTFLELTAHKYGVDIHDLQEIFMNGMDYWYSIEDEEKSPEEYGIAFVNKAILNEKRKGWFTKEKPTHEKIIDAKNREHLKRIKDEISRARANPNYAPEISADDDDELKRYIVRIDEDPENHLGSRVGVHKVLGYTAHHAYLIAMKMHKDLRGGELPAPKKRQHWNVTIGSDRSAPGTEGMGVSKWARRKPKKAQTGIGKIFHWKGKIEQEIDSAPKVKKKKKRGGGRGVPVSVFSGDGDELSSHDAPPRRRRRKSEQAALEYTPPSLITHEPSEG